MHRQTHLHLIHTTTTLKTQKTSNRKVTDSARSKRSRIHSRRCGVDSIRRSVNAAPLTPRHHLRGAQAVAESFGDEAVTGPVDSSFGSELRLRLRLWVVRELEAVMIRGGSREEETVVVVGAAEFLQRGDAALLPVELGQVGDGVLHRQYREWRNVPAERRARQVH